MALITFKLQRTSALAYLSRHIEAGSGTQSLAAIIECSVPRRALQMDWHQQGVAKKWTP